MRALHSDLHTARRGPPVRLAHRGTPLKAAFLLVLSSLAPPTLALDLPILERTLEGGTVEHVWHAADSLERAGVISPAIAASLKARAANRPGTWGRWAGAADSLFARAIVGMQEEKLATRQDSIWFFSVMLDRAYYHARAAAVGLAGHAEAEEATLRAVLVAAPLESQRARAAFELGRTLRFRSGPYAAEADCTLAAERYLRAALSADADDVRPYALWQLGWLEAESGRWDETVRSAERLSQTHPTAKWQPRAAAIIGMRSRRELTVDDVVVADERIRMRGTMRNLSGPLVVSLARIDAAWVHRRGRVPFSSERVKTERAATTTAALDPRPDAEAWVAELPVPAPGFYRCRVAIADTTVTFTIGVLNTRLDVLAGDSLCVVNGVREVVTVRAASDGRVEARDLSPGALWCVGAEEPGEFIVYDGSRAGWCGRPRAGASWLVWVDGASAPR